VDSATTSTPTCTHGSPPPRMSSAQDITIFPIRIGVHNRKDSSAGPQGGARRDADELGAAAWLGEKQHLRSPRIWAPRNVIWAQGIISHRNFCNGKYFVAPKNGSWGRNRGEEAARPR
jgi:hypothetical protein